MENFVKQSSLDYFKRLQETNDKIDGLNVGSSDMPLAQKLNLMEQDIVKLKNLSKMRDRSEGLAD